MLPGVHLFPRGMPATSLPLSHSLSSAPGAGLPIWALQSLHEVGVLPQLGEDSTELFQRLLRVPSSGKKPHFPRDLL